MASAANANAKLLKANRLDGALTTFRGAPTPESLMELDRTLRLEGMDNKTIRGHLTGEMVKVKSNADFEALMNTPYGPNGQSFQDQYPQEAAQLRVDREKYLQQGVQAMEMTRNRQDREAIETARQTVAKDRADGSFDASPERLQELADNARAAGLDKTAQFWEGQISETAYMKNSEQVKEQYEMQIAAGVIPSNEEILQNPALSQEHKQAILSKTKSSASGGAMPTTDIAKTHKSIIEDSIRQRGKWTRDGANDPGVAAMEGQALQEYAAVYNRELAANGGDTTAAANAALNDFKSKFGTDATKGQYALGPEPGTDPSRIGKYVGYDPSGVASTTVNPMNQIRKKVAASGGDYNGVLNTQGELYDGESTSLQNLQKL